MRGSVAVTCTPRGVVTMAFEPSKSTRIVCVTPASNGGLNAPLATSSIVHGVSVSTP